MKRKAHKNYSYYLKIYFPVKIILTNIINF